MQENQFSPGAGLGLNMVRDLVKSMGGDISIRSKVGVGTEVKVNLPIRLSRKREVQREDQAVKLYQVAKDLSKLEAYRSPVIAVASRSPSPRNDPGSSSRPAASSPAVQIRVLVSDDNTISRKVLTTFLSRRKVTYAEAEDGLEAFNKFKSFRPHLVFTDVSMPVMDGVESASKMREYEQEQGLAPAWIVALTGLSRENVHEDRSSIDEWLTKGGPTNLKTLGNIVDRIRARMVTPPLSAPALV
jgi:CheY-like chemotaxis protein